MSYDGSITIPTNDSPILLFDGARPTVGYEICNVDEVYDLWISDTGTASLNGLGSFRIVAGGGTYVTPHGYSPLGPVSVFSAKPGPHKVTARGWGGTDEGGTQGPQGARGPVGPPGPQGEAGVGSSEAPITTPGAPIARSAETRFLDVVNAADWLPHNGTAITLAQIEALQARLEQSDLSTAQYAGSPNVTAKALYFPGGQYYYNGFTTLKSWGTGAAFYGDGRATVLRGIGIILEDDFSSVQNLGMMSAGDFGIKKTNCKGTLITNVFIRDRTDGYLKIEGGFDNMSDCFFYRCVNGLQFNGTGGESHHTNVTVMEASQYGLYIKPTPEGNDVVAGLKFTSCSFGESVVHGMYVDAGTGTFFESYLTECTFGGNEDVINPIINAVQLGGTPNVTRFETQNDHFLLPGMVQIHITDPRGSTTGYQNNYGIVAVTDQRHFDVNSTPKGVPPAGTQVDEKGFDVFFKMPTTQHQINDIFFKGGNANHVRLSGYNLQLSMMRLKERIWLDNVQQMGLPSRIYRGRNGPGTNYTYNLPNDVVVGGPGSATGWGDGGYASGDPDTFTAGAGRMVMRVPNNASGLNGLVPATTNRIEVTETGVKIYEADVDVTPW